MRTIPRQFPAYVVDRDPAGHIVTGLRTVGLKDLNPGEVLIRVQWSGVNYKDILAAAGHRGIVSHFPHVPGIDAVGVVVEDTVSNLTGTTVLVTGYGLGTEVWGGFGAYIRVPKAWCIPIPAEWDVCEMMALGTAGLTAALSLDALLGAGITPDQGAVVVTGATGGVGSTAVAILAQYGFRVTAVTRQKTAHAALIALGADTVLDMAQWAVLSPKALLSEQWVGAVDTVGGGVLGTLLKSIAYGGAVATCGMVAGTTFESSVYPFIIRGVRLLGVDSVYAPYAHRLKLWTLLATTWRPTQLQALYETIDLADLPAVLSGKRYRHPTRRTVVAVAPQ